MSTPKKFTVDLQKELAAKLSALPKAEPTELSKKDFVAGLREQIKFAEAQGYTLQQIAEILKSDGVEIAPATLKTYLQSSKPNAKRVKKNIVAATSPEQTAGQPGTSAAA